MKNYSDINLFLDNDNAGFKCKNEILKSFPEAKDHSVIYSDHKDLNEFLNHRIKNEVENLAQKKSEESEEANKTLDRNEEQEIKDTNSFRRKR